MGTLVLGLGGTGIKSLIHVKKLLQDARQSGDLPGDVQIMGIDTRQTPEHIDLGDTSWITSIARQEQRQYTGQVDITDNEYFWLGGNLTTWMCGNPVQGIPGADPALPHINRWLDIRHFCNDPSANAVLNVIHGAGMYRQVGRLGLFHNLINGPQSALYTRLRAKLTALGAGGNHRVIICGSLAGGTGASLFQDMAHLTKMIAQHEVGVNSIDVMALLVLPEAFSWTPGVTVDPRMKARGLAGLREMMRFMTVNDQNLGFQMQYGPGGVVLDSRSAGSLFSQVYLLESRSPDPTTHALENPLDTTIEYGLAPIMATWIADVCDASAGQAVNAWAANLSYLATGVHAAGNGNPGQNLAPSQVKAVAGSFSTYSIVLPKALIIESWVARLAFETLDVLVPLSAEGQPTQAFIVDRIDSQQVTTGATKSRDDWSLNPSLIARDAGELGQGNTNDPQANANLVGNITVRDVQAWRRIFLDRETPDSDQDVFDEMAEKKTYFYNEEVGFWGDPLKGAIMQKVSARSQTGSHRQAAERLESACMEEYKKIREKWESTLKRRVEHQFKLFKNESIKFMRETLNGGGAGLVTAPGHVALNKPGSLPWVWDYTRQQEATLRFALHRLELAKNTHDHKVKSLEDELVGGDDKSASIIVQMQVNEKHQTLYLKKRQEWFSHSRSSLLCAWEIEAIRRMYVWVNHLHKRLNDYAQMILEIKKYAEKKVNAMAPEATADFNEKLARVREIVRDSIWEERKYQSYLNPSANQPNGLVNVLNNVVWSMQEVEKKKSEKPGDTDFIPEPGLQLTGWQVFGNRITNTNLMTVNHPPNKIVEWNQEVEENFIRLQELCRTQFEAAWHNLNVVEFLEYKAGRSTGHESPQQLAQRVANKSNILLKPGQNLGGVGLTSLAYLIVPEGTQTHNYNNTALQTLAGQVNAGANFSSVITHADQSTITFFVMQHGFDIKTLDAYLLARTDYLNSWPSERSGHEIKMVRATNQIFRAEQEVSKYDYFDSAGQPHLVSSRVAIPFDEPERLDQFLLAWALDIIKCVQEALPGNGANGWVYRADMLVSKMSLGVATTQTYTWRLNNPSYYQDGNQPNALSAAMNYCLRMQDYSNPPMLMRDLYPLISDRVEVLVKERLNNIYLPIWETGGRSTAGQIAAVHETSPDLRVRLLLIEARKQIQRELHSRIDEMLHQPNLDLEEREFLRLVQIIIERRVS